MDADGDGTVTYDEFKAVAGKKPKADDAKMEKAFKKKDADGDGKLTEEEMKGGEKDKKGKKEEPVASED